MLPLKDNVPTRTFPLVTVALIAANVAVFLWERQAFAPRVNRYSFYPCDVVDSCVGVGRHLPWYEGVFSGMFMHASWTHLLGNMLFLWIFGNNVEDAMGHVRFAIFYLLCGVVAALAQALPNPDSTLPMIGASGAISGVLGAYLLLFPHARVLVLIPLGFYSRLVPLPAMVVLGFWFVLQLISTVLADPRAGGVAFGAHIGGFIAGMVLLPIFKYRHVRLFAPSRH